MNEPMLIFKYDECVCEFHCWPRKANCFPILQIKLEQLEHLRSEDTPRRLMITHTIDIYWIS